MIISLLGFFCFIAFNKSLRLTYIIDSIIAEDIFQTIYKGDQPPSLWEYEEKVTLERVMIDLQQNNLEKEFPILHQFIVKVRNCTF